MGTDVGSSIKNNQTGAHPEILGIPVGGSVRA